MEVGGGYGGRRRTAGEEGRVHPLGVAGESFGEADAGGAGGSLVVLVGDSLGSISRRRCVGVARARGVYLDEVAELEEAGVACGERVVLPQPRPILECAIDSEFDSPVSFNPQFRKRTKQSRRCAPGAPTRTSSSILEFLFCFRC